MLLQIALLGAVLGEAQERNRLQLLVSNLDAEPVAELAQVILPHLLLLMGDVLPFAGLAQDWAAHIIKLPLKAAGLSIGVSANFLWPKILRRWGEKIDKSDTPPGGHA